MKELNTSNDVKREKETIIFDAACRVIRSKGFHQARITDIAQAAGISYGLVYHYFKSKTDLFEAIQRYWWQNLFNMMDQSEQKSASPEEKLADIVNYFLDVYEKKPDIVHIFITEISRASSNLTPDKLEWFKLFMSRTEKIIAEGQSTNILRNDIKSRYLTYIFLGSLETFLSTMVLEKQPLRGRSQKQRISDAILEVFFNGSRPGR